MDGTFLKQEKSMQNHLTANISPYMTTGSMSLWFMHVEFQSCAAEEKHLEMIIPDLSLLAHVFLDTVGLITH